jgi:hypothetical protein
LGQGGLEAFNLFAQLKRFSAEFLNRQAAGNVAWTVPVKGLNRNQNQTFDTCG